MSFFTYKLYIDSTKVKENITLYDLYYNVDNVALNIQKMGIMSSTILDIKRTIFGFETKVVEVYK